MSDLNDKVARLMFTAYNKQLLNNIKTKCIGKINLYDRLTNYGATYNGFTFSDSLWDFDGIERVNPPRIKARLTRELAILSNLDTVRMTKRLEMFEYICNEVRREYSNEDMFIAEFMLLELLNYNFKHSLPTTPPVYNWMLSYHNDEVDYLYNYRSCSYLNVLYSIWCDSYNKGAKILKLYSIQKNGDLKSVFAQYNASLQDEDKYTKEFIDSKIEEWTEVKYELTSLVINDQDKLMEFDQDEEIRKARERCEARQASKDRLIAQFAREQEQRKQEEELRIARETEEKNKKIAAEIDEIASKVPDVADASDIDSVLVYVDAVNKAKDILLKFKISQNDIDDFRRYNKEPFLAYGRLRDKLKVSSGQDLIIISTYDREHIRKELFKLYANRNKASYAKSLQKIFGFTKLTTLNLMATKYGDYAVAVDSDKVSDIYHIGIMGTGMKATAFHVKKDKAVFHYAATYIITGLSRTKSNKLVIKMATLSKDGLKEVLVRTSTAFETGKKYGVTIFDKLKDTENRKTYIMVKLEYDVYRLTFDFSGNLLSTDKIDMQKVSKIIKSETKITDKNELLTRISFINDKLSRNDITIKTGGNENG